MILSFKVSKYFYLSFRSFFSSFGELHAARKWCVLPKCSTPNYTNLSNPTVCSYKITWLNSLLRVVRQWYRLPREVADAPSLEVFNTELSGALGS